MAVMYVYAKYIHLWTPWFELPTLGLDTNLNFPPYYLKHNAVQRYLCNVIGEKFTIKLL